MQKFRKECDSLGCYYIANRHYYGIHTRRALHNFPISNTPIQHIPFFTKSLGNLKYAVAHANRHTKTLDAKKGKAIEQASLEVANGQFDNEFVVDVVQGGAGTSTNMNANEIITNRALEIMGYEKGRYDIIHPNDHVNLSQSTNDVYPSAVRLTLIDSLPSLIDQCEKYVNILTKLADKWDDKIKMGRTQLQDAIPMTIGQELQAMADQITHILEDVPSILKDLSILNMGGTAIGTGVNAPDDLGSHVALTLTKIYKRPIYIAENPIAATSSTTAIVRLNHWLKLLAMQLNKQASDFIILASGPKAGLMDYILPSVQAGSSIMPGKVNPVIMECLSQVTYIIYGTDAIVTAASRAGQLQLNAMEPVMLASLSQSIFLLNHALHITRRKALQDLQINDEHNDLNVKQSPGLATYFNSILGYMETSNIVKEAQKTGKNIVDIIISGKLISELNLKNILDFKNLTKPKPKKSTLKNKGDKKERNEELHK